MSLQPYTGVLKALMFFVVLMSGFLQSARYSSPMWVTDDLNRYCKGSMAPETKNCFVLIGFFARGLVQVRPLAGFGFLFISGQSVGNNRNYAPTISSVLIAIITHGLAANKQKTKTLVC